MAEHLATTKKAGGPDTHAQFLVLQLRMRAVMPEASGGHEPWLPSTSGLLLEYESAGAYETYHLCPDGQVALAFLVNDRTKHGTWTLDGDVLKLRFIRETKKEGVGEPLPMPEGQEGPRQYNEYTHSERPIEESATLSWTEVLEDLSSPTPSFFTPRRGTPTCR